jgi:hypothetical protein
VIRIHVNASLVGPTVEANEGGWIIAEGARTPGDWSADGYFYANYYGVIRAFTALNAANLATTSPAHDTLGNTQSMVLTT